MARKLTVLVWHHADEGERLIAHKVRSMEPQVGKPHKKGNKSGPSHAYHVKELRDQEMQIARRAQKVYEHFIEAWRPRPPKERARRLNPARLE
ncbi:hypothetical protein [Mesorhizobium sp.]|uniref:hypothetical protein n=1 Tax=Mesorhizobium sp. TaxID=1871066 RepID=UPI0025C3E7F3|nr:hypothetical protein [Mesorhizobium sp.]